MWIEEPILYVECKPLHGNLLEVIIKNVKGFWLIKIPRIVQLIQIPMFVQVTIRIRSHLGIINCSVPKVLTKASVVGIRLCQYDFMYMSYCVNMHTFL